MDPFHPRANARSEKAAPDLGSGYFGWIWKLIRIPEPTVIECAGYDAAVYLRLTKLGVQVFSFTAIYGLLILIPVYATQWYAWPYRM